MKLYNEQIKYVISYLNSKSESLSLSVSRILSKVSYSAQIDANVVRVIKMVSEVDRIFNLLHIKEIPHNNFFEQLYLIKSCNIPEVNNFLDKYKYIFSDQNETTKEPKENKTVGEDYEQILKSALVKRVEIPYENFENIIVEFATKIIRRDYPSASCKIVESNKICGKESYTLKTHVYLNKDLVQKLYYSGDYRIIKNIFHEACHIKQYKKIKLDYECDDFIIKQIKEEILSSFYPGYYDLNYEIISYEAEAELYGITEFLKLLKKLGVEFINNSNPFLVSINYRETSFGLQSLDEMFDIIIMHRPELLDEYPQLKMNYEIGFEDLVIRKDEFGRKD